MNDHLEFCFVYSKDAVKIKSFLGLIPRNIECINYMDIYNKLSKNDYMQSEPSDAVITSYLMKDLQLALGKRQAHSLYYVLGDLNKTTVEGIKNYVRTLTVKSIRYKLYYTPGVIFNETEFLFDEIAEFEVDL
jgi:hypothetical protein